MSTIINGKGGEKIMKRLAFIFALVILYVAIAGGGQEASSAQGAETITLLKQAFATTAATPGGAELYGWAMVAEEYYSPRQAEEAAAVMASAFELNRNEYKIQLRSTGYYGYAVLEYDLSQDVFLRIQVQSVDDETIASIELRQQHQRGLEKRVEQIQMALESLGIGEKDVKITSCLEGYLDARLGNSEKLNLVYTAFNSVDAEYREGMEEDGVAVWSGWSPQFEQSVSNNRGNINFGIAFRHESGSNKTMVRVATPVLPGSY